MKFAPRACSLEFITEKRKRRGKSELVGNLLSVIAGTSNSHVLRSQNDNLNEGPYWKGLVWRSMSFPVWTVLLNSS